MSEVAGPDQSRRVAGTIEAFDALGWHRTGTGVDNAGAAWLADRARSTGVDAALEPWSLSRLVPAGAFAEVDGERVDGLPLFDGGLTGEAGIEGRFGDVGSSADVAVAEVGSGSGARFHAARRAHGHRALVAVWTGRRPGLMALNAPAFGEPFGVPVLQVSSTALPYLRSAAERGSRGRVVVHATREPSESANVVALVRGRDAQRPVVVTTPRTGWWHCAGERGGGIACWLEVMREVSGAELARDVWFAAFAGHELGHLGLDAYLARRADVVGRAYVWVHFGANIGARSDAEPAVRLSASDERILGAAADALRTAGVEGVLTAAPGTVMGGESAVVHRAGATTVALLGTNPLFHLVEDRWPDAVDVESVTRQATAFSRVVLALASA